MPKLKVPGQKRDRSCLHAPDPRAKKPRRHDVQQLGTAATPTAVMAEVDYSRFYTTFGASDGEVSRSHYSILNDNDNLYIIFCIYHNNDNLLYIPLQEEFEGFIAEEISVPQTRHVEAMNGSISLAPPVFSLPSSSSSSPLSTPISSRSPSPLPAQLTQSGHLRKRRVRCNQCEACLCQVDCGKCMNCK